jgi:hypothetical protein
MTSACSPQFCLSVTKLTMVDSVERSPWVRTRVTNACDTCKRRKIKCDGKHPSCNYCQKNLFPCNYSPHKRRRPRVYSRPSPPTAENENGHLDRSVESSSRSATSPSRTAPGTPIGPHTAHGTAAAATPRQSRALSTEDETDVPREARLLSDGQGKLLFIGDCAPLSFFQTVRQLVTSRIDHNAFAPQTSRYSVLENGHRQRNVGGKVPKAPELPLEDVDSVLSTYLSVTAGLVDLFQDNYLQDNMTLWAGLGQKSEDINASVNYLVFAIGSQSANEEVAHTCFEYARQLALTSLNGNLSVETVQAFILITLYMLGACQINGAFLFFGIAVRSAYSIGIHRTEVNARFGSSVRRQRDRLWKSLRVLDLYLSASMGRPPATSDVDCTVSYRSIGEDGEEIYDVLNASVQIMLIIEGIVVEIYSRRKISLQLTEGISRQLRDWSVRWLQHLKDAMAVRLPVEAWPQTIGACQVMSSYYYAVMLVSRPFLMYELYKSLSDNIPPALGTKSDPISGKTKLADACIDAASLMLDPIVDLISRGLLKGSMPLIV